MYQRQFDSPLGNLLLECTDAGLTGIYMNRENHHEQDDHPILHRTAAWLDAYFRGESLPAEIPLAPDGTDFQKQVWKILLTIPYGGTTTYGDIARKMAALRGKEKMSAQAVGGAVGSNPISIIIPCHRVVAAGGKLGGFGWGPDAKKWLLRHEGGNYDDQ